ncbi:MAG: hypothetical protein OXP66_01110 [Candidatus Tectomicrobia bacterium]|nr:hypothetical protein [Candidatus Tectomicrobia bacterium]
MVALVVAFTLLIVLAGVVLWAGGSEIAVEERGVGIVEAMPRSLAESSFEPSDILTLYSYNLGYGLGDAEAGTAQSREAIHDRLDRVIEGIAASEADAALLRAVDFASRRTAFIPQLHYVAEALGWRYVAAISTWECRYLPLPRSQAGRVRAGQGIISRLPLEHNSWRRFARPRWTIARPALPFAPHDAVQVVDMRCGVRGIRLLQAHLASSHGGCDERRQEELLEVLRRMGMPGCVVTGVDERTAGEIGRVLSFQAKTGGVLLGSTWSSADVRVLTPLSGVSAHAPVLVRLKL